MGATQKQMIESIMAGIDQMAGDIVTIKEQLDTIEVDSIDDKADLLLQNVTAIASAVANTAHDKHLADMLIVIRCQRDIIGGVLQHIASWDNVQREELSSIIINNTSWRDLEAAQKRLDEYLKQQEVLRKMIEEGDHVQDSSVNADQE